MPQMLALPVSVGLNTTAIFEDILEYYLGNKALIDTDNPKSIQGFINVSLQFEMYLFQNNSFFQLYTDRAFTYGTYQNVILQSKKGHKPIWMYNFNYKGQYTYGDKFAATTKNIDFQWG